MSNLTSTATFEDEPKIIGLYGISGCGKSYLLGQLKESFGDEFDYYEGSQKIAGLVPGGLAAFQGLGREDQESWRKEAIREIKKGSLQRNKSAIVTGHFSFWSETDDKADLVCTEGDLTTFSHILYLNLPTQVISQRRQDDVKRQRPTVSTSHLGRWQATEINELRRLCIDNDILFMTVPSHEPAISYLAALLPDLQRHGENYNRSVALSKLDKIVDPLQGELETMLVIDGDKTLIAEDTGALFWERSKFQPFSGNQNPLRVLFGSKLGYSYRAFRQATLLYEEMGSDDSFEIVCEEVASAVHMHPEFNELLRTVAKKTWIGVTVVTCGLRSIWEKIIAREGLRDIVTVIGGGRVSDGYVVTASVKAALVQRLKRRHNLHVWAFGDSPLDLGMLSRADEAIVVVGDQSTRSQSMDVELQKAIENGYLQARQIVLPSNARPRLDCAKLPLVSFNATLIASLLERHGLRQRFPMIHATKDAATRILMTPMRNAGVSGVSLRKAHDRVGQYLATRYLTELIGLEEFSIPHVQGHVTQGFRFLHEETTLIVALMRGGEPMAFGVNKILPLAMFLHAKEAADLTVERLSGKQRIILVDSVINSGRTVQDFLRYIRGLNKEVHIVILAGVVQAKAVSEGKLAQMLALDAQADLVALRLSNNKFTGQGGTDTGNRLFNTTHLL